MGHPQPAPAHLRQLAGTSQKGAHVTTSEQASTVRCETADAGIATITLNRPDVMNAISQQMRAELSAAVRAADTDDQVRAILLRGAGDRAFCAGADIREFRPPQSVVVARQDRAGPIWNDLINASCKPTVAAVHGYCLGGGLEIALACDLRIAADDAVFGFPEVRLGIIPGAGGTQRLPRLVGPGQALRLILTGQRIDAAEALRIGLVSEVVPRGELTDRALAYAAQLSRGAPRAIEYAKEAILRGSELSLADGLRLESDLATLLMSTDDRVEGAAAFREHRTPRFTGH
jgi:enoyl-CoA hydratase/carnithine racemase